MPLETFLEQIRGCFKFWKCSPSVRCPNAHNILMIGHLEPKIRLLAWFFQFFVKREVTTAQAWKRCFFQNQATKIQMQIENFVEQSRGCFKFRKCSPSVRCSNARKIVMIGYLEQKIRSLAWFFPVFGKNRGKTMENDTVDSSGKMWLCFSRGSKFFWDGYFVMKTLQGGPHYSEH
jgi:hypothetical protein